MVNVGSTSLAKASRSYLVMPFLDKIKTYALAAWMSKSNAVPKTRSEILIKY